MLGFAEQFGVIRVVALAVTQRGPFYNAAGAMCGRGGLRGELLVCREEVCFGCVLGLGWLCCRGHGAGGSRGWGHGAGGSRAGGWRRGLCHGGQADHGGEAKHGKQFGDFSDVHHTLLILRTAPFVAAAG